MSVGEKKNTQKARNGTPVSEVAGVGYAGLALNNDKGDAVRRALDNDLNPFTGTSHTPQYKTILEERKKLPVFVQMDEFLEVFNKNQVIVVAGATGSGKTTQIPQFVAFCDLPHTKGKMVACTQPRGMAAMSFAKRVADEMDVQVGQHVGYSIRFEDMTDPRTTFLKYMTDDMLLHEAMHDNNFERYSTIILDEAQERTLSTDILMGLLKQVTKRRSDPKIIVICATPDGIKFQKYFSLRSGSQAPLFKVSSREHPIEIFYVQEPEPDYFVAAIRTVLMIHKSEEQGDILLFLTGEKEIEEACWKIEFEAEELINKDPESVGPLVCIPLHSSLTPEEQQRIFNAPPAQSRVGRPPGRKVVVSTNIAETSLTIDGVVYVVDPGFSKEPVYNPRLRVEILLASPISKESAQQRASCAGRTRPGKCFRLYKQKDFNKLEKQTYPWILRSNLANAVMKLVNSGIMDLVHFDYLDAPAPETLMRALELLNVLGAMDEDGNVTAEGKLMAEFPLDPRLAKLLISSPALLCSNEILTIVAMLSVPNVWVRPLNQRSEADAAKEKFIVPESDHLTLLNVYNQYILTKYDKNWTRENYLSRRTLAQAENVRTQLQRIMERLDLDLVSLDDETKLFLNVRKALVCGFSMQVAHREGVMGSYATVKDHQVVAIHPSCGLKTRPEWVLFDNFILTTQPYITTVTEVRAEWLLECAPLYFDPKTFPAGEAKSPLRARKQEKRKGKPNVEGRGMKRKMKE